MEKINIFIFLLVIFLSICILKTANSQSFTIIIQLEQPPPNELNLYHLWKANLTNTSGKEMKIYLEGFVEEEKDGRIVEGQTKVFSMPAGKKSFQYEDFKNGSVKWFPKKTDYKTIITETGKTPEGVYTICMTAKNEEGEIVGMENCIVQPVIIPTNPEITLIAPEDDAKLEDINPVFVWSPPMPAPKEKVTYGFRIVEVKTGQSLEDAEKNNTAVFEEKAITTTQYKYPAKGQILKEEIKYAWAITAGDIMSEVWSFIIIPSEEEKKTSEKPPVVNNVYYYYDLTKENTGNYITENRDSLKVQFINNYASVSNINFNIYDAGTFALINPKIKGNDKLNNMNGLNRISINLKNYNLKPGNLYLLIVSDFKSNYYMNFKVNKSY